MGKAIDLDSPLSPEDKQYLRDRGRGYLIPANERRFGEDGTRTPEPHEHAGASAQSQFYDNQERDRAVYDQGGAPLPGVVLDHDTGRAYDRENGVTVEFTGPGHTASGYDPRIGYEAEGFRSGSTLDANGNIIDDDQFDPDIVEYVTSAENKGVLQAELTEHEVPFDKDAKREVLQDKLIVFYQDLRNSGVEVSFEDSEDGEDSDDDGEADADSGDDGEEKK